MVKITFKKGDKTETVDVPVGTSILEAAHEFITDRDNIDLEGACEGSLACSTCHVILEEEFFGKLESPSEDEEDMLDMAFGLTQTSRLGCQISVTEELEGATFTIPSKNRNS